jgi:hypothetical protein
VFIFNLDLSEADNVAATEMLQNEVSDELQRMLRNAITYKYFVTKVLFQKGLRVS